MSESSVALAAGGTGGHFFAALAVAQELKEKNLSKPLIVTDLQHFPLDHIERILIPEMSLKGSFFKKALSAFKALGQILRLAYLYKKQRTQVVVGFGGYTSFVPCIAAKLCCIPIILHEQNAILGRANKVMAQYADVISLGFPTSLPSHLAKKSILTKNPVRKEFKVSKANNKGCPFSILVIGGSQGAGAFNLIVPQAMKIVRSKYAEKAILVEHQSKDQELKATYETLNIKSHIAPFFSNMQVRYAEADLVICRAGASTLEELVQTAKPAILIPLPNSANNHQKLNAQHFASRKAAWLVEQKASCHLEVASLIMQLIEEPKLLKEASAALQKICALKTCTLLDLIALQIRKNNNLYDRP
jgi:UDP-N-acetylglucosamine--N-acetylmuramyl-(pentapeptide) pyrophosphoryl-undecaprenol N-acetylglucosamine transferase